MGLSSLLFCSNNCQIRRESGRITTMNKKIYLDYAASTPIDKKVLDEMLPYLKKHYGNPSSSHAYGQKTKAAIEEARIKVAKFLGCQADEIVFTGGATEANNLAIQGVIRKQQTGDSKQKPHIITSSIEHESILEPCKTLEKEGLAEITYVKPQKDGIVRVEDIQKEIREHTVLISIMYANSEIGTIQPIQEIGELLKQYKIQDTKYKILFHTDAVQAANFLECDAEKLGVDLLTLSGHKIYGPKGVGVLYVRERTPMMGIVEGGGQEGGLRSGTENVSGVVGLGVAVEGLQNPRMTVTNIRIRQLRDRLIKKILQRIPDVEVTGSLEKRLPNNVHFRFKEIEGRDLVILMDQKGIAISTGSACAEKTQEPSHVLLALGLNAAEALWSVRISLGKQTKQDEIDKTIKVLAASVDKLQSDAHNNR